MRGRQIYVATPYGARVADIVVEIEGKLHGIEVKSGGGVLATLQRLKDTWINTIGTAQIFGTAAHDRGIHGEVLQSMVEWWVP